METRVKIPAGIYQGFYEHAAKRAVKGEPIIDTADETERCIEQALWARVNWLLWKKIIEERQQSGHAAGSESMEGFTSRETSGCGKSLSAPLSEERAHLGFTVPVSLSCSLYEDMETYAAALDRPAETLIVAFLAAHLVRLRGGSARVISAEYCRWMRFPMAQLTPSERESIIGNRESDKKR